MRIEQDQSTHPRLLRKPGLGEAPTATGIEVKARAKKPKGSRFVGPTQLEEDQKLRIGKALKKKQIGDEMGRQIFIGAVEYQIGAFAEQMARPAAPEPVPQGLSAAVEETLQAIVGSAASLSSLLRALPEGAKARVTETLAARGEVGHGYDESYLCELGLEIDRLGRACIAAAGEPEPGKSEPGKSEPKSKPTLTSVASRELIAKLAGAFSDCFEMEPTADEDGDFHASLEILGEVTGLAIGREPAFLAKILGARVPKR